jgi:hypothetical protein
MDSLQVAPASYVVTLAGAKPIEVSDSSALTPTKVQVLVVAHDIAFPVIVGTNALVKPNGGVPGVFVQLAPESVDSMTSDEMTPWRPTPKQVVVAATHDMP